VIGAAEVGAASRVITVVGAKGHLNTLEGVPGRVQYRVNLANDGMEHLVSRHLSGKVKRKPVFYRGARIAWSSAKQNGCEYAGHTNSRQC
jgi:hypothetical protein